MRVYFAVATLISRIYVKTPSALFPHASVLRLFVPKGQPMLAQQFIAGNEPVPNEWRRHGWR